MLIKLYIMNLKELLTRVGFEALLPHLRVEPETAALYGYREAYDRLAAMQPNPDYQGEVRVEWSGDEQDEGRWIGVHHLAGDYWENDLAKEIVVADDVHLSIEEVAAKCLWEITFYGFSPREITQNVRSMCDEKPPANVYEVALERLEESIWRHQTPRRLRSKRKGYTLFDKAYFRKCFGESRMNRSKRKREYRQKQRSEFLEKSARRQRVIDELTAPGSSLPPGSLDFLYGVKQGVRYDFCGVDAARPLDYIRESMTRYLEVDRAKFDNAVIVLQQPASAVPLPVEEIERFEADMRRHWEYADMHFGWQPVPVGDEIRAVVLLNKMK